MREFKLIEAKKLSEEDQKKYDLYPTPKWDDRNHLFEVVDGRVIRLVAEDGGEPEDQSFGRDWSWVLVELNKLAAEIDKLKGG